MSSKRLFVTVCAESFNFKTREHPNELCKDNKYRNFAGRDEYECDGKYNSNISRQKITAQIDNGSIKVFDTKTKVLIRTFYKTKSSWHTMVTFKDNSTITATLVGGIDPDHLQEKNMDYSLDY